MTRVSWAINVLIQFSLSTKEIARLKERHFVLKKKPPRFFWTIEAFFVSEKNLVCWNLCFHKESETEIFPKNCIDCGLNGVDEYTNQIYFWSFFAKFNGLKSVTIVNKPQNEIEVQLQVVLLLALNNCSFFRGWPIWWSFLQRPMERSQYFEAWQIVPVTFIGGGKSFFSVFYITVRFVNKVHCPVSLSLLTVVMSLLSCVTV